MFGLTDTVAALLAAIPAAPVRSLLVIGVGAFLEGPIVTVAAAALAAVREGRFWAVPDAGVLLALAAETEAVCAAAARDDARPQKEIVG